MPSSRSTIKATERPFQASRASHYITVQRRRAPCSCSEGGVFSSEFSSLFPWHVRVLELVLISTRGIHLEVDRIPPVQPGFLPFYHHSGQRLMVRFRPSSDNKQYRTSASSCNDGTFSVLRLYEGKRSPRVARTWMSPQNFSPILIIIPLLSSGNPFLWVRACNREAPMASQLRCSISFPRLLPSPTTCLAGTVRLSRRESLSRPSESRGATSTPFHPRPQETPGSRGLKEAQFRVGATVANLFQPQYVPCFTSSLTTVPHQARPAPVEVR